MINRNPFFLLYLIFGYCTANSQSVPVDNFASDNDMRYRQLMGVADNRSYTLKPVSSLNESDDSTTGFNKSKQSVFTFLGAEGAFRLLPFDWVQQYNSHHPYGWNDGAMIPAKGYQTMISTGMYAKWGWLSVQLKPEMVYAANPGFQTFPSAYSDTVWRNYYSAVLNGIDAPEQFGSGHFKKAYPGQSFVKLKLGNISIGVSTENLWWGPGIRNSIMLSNSAPGFSHISLYSNKPIKTKIGYFEGQIVGGKLIRSGILPPDTSRTFNRQVLYFEKLKEWRYFSGFIFTWQPKWIPHLYLGIIRTIYEYKSTMDATSGLLKYFPVFQRVFANGIQSAADAQDQLGSLFFRYVLLKNEFEIYAEFARNDHSENLRDLILEPEHSRAYTVGFQKLIDLRNHKSKLGVMGEVTHLQLPTTYLTGRAEPPFYIHSMVLDGYTNVGQYVGAGIGPGANTQSFNIFYLSSKNKIGLLLERYEHNMDFYNSTFNASETNPWIDFSAILNFNKSLNRLSIQSELGVVHSQNYEWWKTSTNRFINGYKDATQLHAKLALRYFW